MATEETDGRFLTVCRTFAPPRIDWPPIPVYHKLSLQFLGHTKPRAENPMDIEGECLAPKRP